MIEDHEIPTGCWSHDHVSYVRELRIDSVLEFQEDDEVPLSSVPIYFRQKSFSRFNNFFVTLLYSWVWFAFQVTN